MDEVPASGDDPRGVLSRAPMRWRQIVAIGVCVLLNALDGFDVLSISFASPGIASEWGVDRAALGVVLSMELFGMAAGSLILGPLADRVGRKPTAVLCLVLMALGMFGAAYASSLGALAALRLVTGVGIGGMLACINAMAAELANNKGRGAAIAIMAAGYPLGAVAGGSIASGLLVDGTWRDVFLFGGIASASMLPLLLFLVPESVGFLARHPHPNRLARVNRALARLGHSPLAALRSGELRDARKLSLRLLFQPDLRATTLLLTVAYFCHVMSFYFIIKWIPKIVVDMGFAPSSAGEVLVFANVGGLAGSLVLSLLTLKVGLRPLMMGVLLFSSAMVILFGRGQADLSGLSLAAACVGFFTNAGIVGFYALIASSFPTEARAGGTGFVIGMGRGGAAMGPVIAGMLFEAGLGLQGVAPMMAIGSLLAVVAVFALRLPVPLSAKAEPA